MLWKRIVYLGFAVLLWGTPLWATTGQPVINLEQAIAQALANNDLIQQAVNELKASRSEFAQAKSRLGPTASLTYNYVNMRDEPFIYFEVMPGVKEKFPSAHEDLVSWEITISQPLFTGFALLSQKELASLGVDIRTLERDQARLEVARQVKVAYAQVLLAQKGVQVAKVAVDQLSSHVKDARNFFAQGIIPRNDLLKSQVACAQAKQSLVQARSQLSVARAHFNLLLKQDMETGFSLQDLPEIPLEQYALDALLVQAVQKRPVVRELEKRLQQARLGIKLAKSEFYPKIALVGQYKHEGDGLLAETNDFANHETALIGLQAKWDFFESGQSFHQLQKARYQKMALKRQLSLVTDQVRLQVKKAYEDLQVAKANISTATQAKAQAQENFRITNHRFQEQMSTSTEVLDARTYLTQAELSFYRAWYGYWMAKAELERAVGQ